MGPVFNSAVELHSNSGVQKIAEKDKYQPPFCQNLFPSQFEDYYKYCSQYYYMMGNDYMQISRPNIISINNVNTNGNALIINNQSNRRSIVIQEEAKPRTENIFEVRVDKEYYRQKYANDKLLPKY